MERSSEYRQLGLRSGEWVEVRSEEAILATLDAKGEVDGLPFMPEMLQFCGRQFRVAKRAEKLCDTIHKTGGRRMMDAVHLEELRCDGSGHGGCQAGCRLVWKEVWLKRIGSYPDEAHAIDRAAGRPDGARDVLIKWASTTAASSSGTEIVYRCQATRMFAATRPMAWWDPRQYWRDLRSGNVPLLRMARAAIIAHCNMVLRRLHREYPRIRWSAEGQPRGDSLELAAGDLVEVKTLPEIVQTLNRRRCHRGLSFDREMVPYCGKQFRVLRRVEKIVDERTGRMVHMRNDCIILDGVVCVGDLSPCRLFCQRATYAYWRETWLRKVETVPGSEERPREIEASRGDDAH